MKKLVFLFLAIFMVFFAVNASATITASAYATPENPSDDDHKTLYGLEQPPGFYWPVDVTYTFDIEVEPPYYGSGRCGITIEYTNKSDKIDGRVSDDMWYSVRYDSGNMEKAVVHAWATHTEDFGWTQVRTRVSASIF